MILFFGLFTWANWNRPNPGENLKPASFDLFNLENIKDQAIFDYLDANLKKTNGVLATCIKPSDKIASVVFYPDILSRNDLLRKLIEWSGSQVAFKKIEASGPTCPVAGVTGSILTIKRMLCVRN